MNGVCERCLVACVHSLVRVSGRLQHKIDKGGNVVLFV